MDEGSLLQKKTSNGTLTFVGARDGQTSHHVAPVP